MALSPAWAVQGGRANAAAARQIAWCATSGASGIITPTDMLVTALAVPGPAVNIRTGGAVIASTYGTAGNTESYAVTNDATVQLAVPGGLSSATTYYVILRIDDYHYNNGPVPAEPKTSLYCRFDLVTSAVLSSVTDPFIQLAKIALPANTATITAGMITDLRDVANPRSESHLIANPVVSGDNGLTFTANTPTGEVFPNAGNFALDIPEWATRVQLEVEWLSVQYTGGNTWGQCWMEWGPVTGTSTRQYSTQTFAFDSTGANSNSRVSWKVADEKSIPASLRGTNTTFIYKAGYDPASTTKTAKMTALSGVVTRVTFLERADQDVRVVD